jgi:hypothetical protein
MASRDIRLWQVQSRNPIMAGLRPNGTTPANAATANL